MRDIDCKVCNVARRTDRSVIKSLFCRHRKVRRVYEHNDPNGPDREWETCERCGKTACVMVSTVHFSLFRGMQRWYS